jgi:ribosomal protein S18 acetylase RimI-like enzyme
MAIDIVEVKQVTPALVAAFARLMPQLIPGAVAPGAAELEEIVRGPGTQLLAAVEERSYLGVVTLVVFRIPSGKRARIESLVVDAGARGRGVGRALCRAAMDRARDIGADCVDLTSLPAREAANRLYASLGFKLRPTNAYRHRFGDPRSSRADP